MSQNLVDIQSLDFIKIHEELAEIQAAIEDTYGRPFPSIPIIEETIKEKVPKTWKVGRSDTATRFNEGDRSRKKRKRSKKSERRDVEAAKVEIIQDEQDHQKRVREMAMKVSS